MSTPVEIASEIARLRRELEAWQHAVGDLDDKDAQHVYKIVDEQIAKDAPVLAEKKLGPILGVFAGWRQRVGLDYTLAKVKDFVEGAYLSGYVHALRDHGLSPADLIAEIADREDP